MNIFQLFFAHMWPHMGEEELKNVHKAFDSNYVAPLGPYLDAFEDAVSNYLGNNLFCVGLSSGTAALHISLILAKINDICSAAVPELNPTQKRLLPK